MPRNGITIALYLILVFASGITVGVVSYRLYSTSTASASTAKPTIGEFRRLYLEGMRTKVGAGPDQLDKVAVILDDTRDKLNELAAKEKPLHDRIREEHIAEIRALLNDQQKVAYDNWRAERARESAANQGK